jgi:hypothetical protein
MNANREAVPYRADLQRAEIVELTANKSQLVLMLVS